MFPELRERPAVIPADAAAPERIEVGDLDAWEARRQEIRRAWDQILGPMPPRGPVQVQVVSREELEDHTRLLIRYANEAETTNDAYLLLPKGFEGKRPGVICLHATTDTSLLAPVGLARTEPAHQALHLVRRGYVCIAPRNYLWAVKGRSWQQAADDVTRAGPYTTGMARMLFDAMRAVDVLADRPEVDPTRIGAIGHSLGGKQALYLPAFDDRIVASISSEGGVGLAMSNWDADWYLGRQIKSPDFTHDNHEIMALIAPRALLVIGGESADGARSWPYIEAVLPIWRLYGQAPHGATARLGLLRHSEGHKFPDPGPTRDLAYRWLDQWLNDPVSR